MGKRRLFFALWPDESACRGLAHNLVQALTHDQGDHSDVRVYLPEDLHLTLAFIGAATETYRTCLARAAREVAEREDSKPFSLAIDRLGYFERGRVLWAGCRSCPASLAGLQDRLVKALAGCGYEGESRTFKPHVTLMRKAGRPQNLHSFTPVPWRIDGFSLAESLPVTDGRRYRIIEEFRFDI